MEEKKCIECGQIIPDNMDECPNCGCPIEEIEDTNKFKEENDLNNIGKKEIKKNISESSNDNKCDKTSKIRMIFTSIALIIGLIAIIMGHKVMSHDVETELHNAGMYDVGFNAFGGDFYTEIYKASDTIVDELNSINNGMSVISNSMKSTIKAIYYGSGMVIIAIGLGIVALSLIEFGKQKKNE